MTRENTASFWRCCGTAQGITSERTTFLNSAIRNSQHQQSLETSRGENVLFPGKDRKHRLSYKKQPSLKSPLFSFFKTWFSKIIVFFQCISYEDPNCSLPFAFCRLSSWRAAADGLLPFSQVCARTGTTVNTFLWRNNLLQAQADFRTAQTTGKQVLHIHCIETNSKTLPTYW